MTRFLKKMRFSLARRFTQLVLLVILFGGNAYGWNWLKGNLSGSKFLDRIPFTDPFALLQIFATGTSVRREALTGALIIILFFGIIGGRSFCSWVCPMNVITDLANWLRKKFGFEKTVTHMNIARSTRYWMLALSLVVSAISGVAAFEWISPVSMLHRGIVYGMGLGWVVMMSVFLFDLFVVNNGFCGHVCPLGGFYSVVSRYSLIRVRYGEGKCTRCMKCVDICPESQVLNMVGKRSGMVVSGECTNCGRCVEVCEDSAMAFGIRYLSREG